MQIIPFKTPAEWSEQIELDGVQYIFNFSWNALNEFWAMDIYTAEELPIILGIKIVPNYNLTFQYSEPNQPQGDILCQNIVNTQEEIGRYDMSQKFELIYYSVGELDAL